MDRSLAEKGRVVMSMNVSSNNIDVEEKAADAHSDC
jgi:hypothetical protein